MLRDEIKNELGLSKGDYEPPAEYRVDVKEAVHNDLATRQKPSGLKDQCKDDMRLSSRSDNARSTSGNRLHSASSTTRSQKTPLVYTSAVEAAENSFTPGAGAYQLEKSFKAVIHKSPAYSLSSRHQSTLLTNPTGPGQYNTMASTLDRRGGEFVKSEQYAGDLKASAVGPGSYTLRKGIEGRGITLSGRHQSIYYMNTPGVGAYNVDRRDKTRFAYTLSGRSDKFMNLYASGTTNAPGVGSYNVQERLGSRGTKFTKYELQGTRNETPGVGSYNVSGQRSRSAGLSLSGRYKGRHF